MADFEKQRNERITFRATTAEKQQLVSAAKRLDMNVSDYVRHKALVEGGVVINDYQMIVDKREIAVWYVKMINSINLVGKKEINQELHKRMEELECLLLK